MTTSGTTAPPEEPHGVTSSPELERPTHLPYRGVCSALARTTGTDVLLWRVLFVVLVFFDGLGILLYLVGLLTIPRVGEAQSVAERLFRGPHRQVRGTEILLIVLTVISAASMFEHGHNLFAVAILAGVVYLFLRGREDAPPAEPVGTPPLVPPVGTAPSFAPVLPTPPTQPRPRSALAALTVGLALLLVGFLALLNTAMSADISAEAILASALAVVGAGLVVGAWWGRSSLLVVVALLLSLSLAAASVVRPVVEAGVGDRTWEPRGAADYRLGMGEATLDLRNMVIDESGPSRVRARVDIGQLVVVVPADVRVTVAMHADMGNLMTPARVSGGAPSEGLETPDVDRGASTGFGGRDIDREYTTGPEGPSRILVEASVRVGQVTVIRRG